MSWLNLNDSLNSLKGQISSFASGVLADGIVNDTDPFTELSQANQKIQELQTLCASQDVEITCLRRQNADFYDKLSKITTSGNTSSGVENGDSWFWDPPSSDTVNASQSNGTINMDHTTNLKERIMHLEKELSRNTENGKVDETLKCRILELEQENKELNQNLEQLDLDCQKTTDKLVTLKDNLQNDFNKLKIDFEKLQQEHNKCMQDINKLESKLKSRDTEVEKLALYNKNLQHEFEQLKSQAEGENPETHSKIDSLSTEKSNLEEQLTGKDETISSLRKELNNLKLEHEKYRTDSIPLEKHKKLQNDFDNLQNKFTEQQNKFSDLESKFNELELKNKNDQEKIYKLNNEFEELKVNDNSNLQINLSDDHKKLQDMFDELKIKYESLSQERKEMHKKYVGILTENVQKYADIQLSDEIITKPNENPLYSEFSSKVESTLKFLLDFKWKTEALERKLCEITREKTVVIAEKNHEIEKLLHNSEILSQEVITKTHTIKDYEIECTALIKNNDLLISELQQYKNNNGLQTISESNEDNLLLMETQLENANKRIKELELIISDMENAKQDVVLETQTELDYIKKQLNMTGRELSQSKTEYQELLKGFKQYEIDNKNMAGELERIQAEFNKCVEEKHSYISHLEKHQNEIENMEYKYTESNIERETLCQELRSTKEELMTYIISDDELQTTNDNLKENLTTVTNELQEMKLKFEASEAKNKDLEMQMRSITEQLQNSSEFKLQNDAMKTEIDNLLENKRGLEQNYSTLQKELNDLKSILSTTGIEIPNSPVEAVRVLVNELGTQNKNIESTISSELDSLNKANQELAVTKNMLEKQMNELENTIKLHDNEMVLLKTKLHNEETSKTDLEKKYLEKRDMVSKLDTQNFELTSKLTQTEMELKNVHASKTELVNLITIKHQENVQYHTEIQRLNQIIATEAEKYKILEAQVQNADNSNLLEEKEKELEKINDQVTFLKEKCEKLAQSLLEQQSNEQKILAERQVILDREMALAKELDRLRVHLVEIEDTYTQELLHAEQKNKEMQTKVNEVEQRERDSSTIYTSVSIRANQQVETLQNQLQLVTAQRDEIQNKISEAEDKNNKQFAALTNLQCVLEQFQRDKEIDIANETERIRRQIKYEKEVQNQLQQEIGMLKAQLQESKQGLIAASRLSEQLERSKKQVSAMKDEVTILQDQMKKTDEKYKAVINQSDGKVDKALVRNLVVGFVGANNNLSKDQTQILKIISTVLDFSQTDNEKLKLNKNQAGSWLSAILHPQVLNSNTNISQHSLSEAFVRFLESESQPKVESGVPTLLDVSRSRKTSETSSTSSRHEGLVLNKGIVPTSVVLPTFADFAQSRSSSAILKDVLKENN